VLLRGLLFTACVHPPENEDFLVNGTLRVHHVVHRQLALLWPPTILLTAASSYLPNELQSSLSFGQSEVPRNTTRDWPNPMHLRHLSNLTAFHRNFICSEFRFKVPGGNIQLGLERRCVLWTLADNGAQGRTAAAPSNFALCNCNSQNAVTFLGEGDCKSLFVFRYSPITYC
jgi:hypothetical protein